MEYKLILAAFEVLQSADWESFFIFHRITVRSQYHADCCVILELQLNLVKGSVHTCLEDIYNIIFHTRKNDLGLRIAESCIVLQHLRSLRGQHQSEEDHALELSAFCYHGIYGLLINIFFTEFIHFIRVERARRKGSHTTGIESLVSIHGALVILGRSHNLDILSIHEA